MYMKWWKVPVILCGALLITALGIDAADTVTGSKNTLLASLFSSHNSSLCPAGMVVLANSSPNVCIDKYEAGVGKKCPVIEPGSLNQTAENLQNVACEPVSIDDTLPWRFVSYRQAEQLCARVGKRLLTNAEWYRAALGTVDNGTSCGTKGSLHTTGTALDCRSGIGAYDMIGNVWELISGEVIDGQLAGVTLPAAGYVHRVDDNGVPTETSAQPDMMYGLDYFWVQKPGTFAVMRGGYYGVGTDGGLYSVHAAISEDFGSEAVGFRCARTL